MAKTKSQIMKDYRARKKAEIGDKWLKQENQRVKGYYVASDRLSKEKQSRRRERNRINKQKSRQKQKIVKESLQETQTDLTEAPSTSSEDGNGVSSTTPNVDLLKVKMPFSHSDRISSGKKRVSRALAKSYRQIKKLATVNKELKKRVERQRKQIERAEKKKPCVTPKSKTDRILKNAGIRPKSVPDIRKRLIYAECVSAEVKEAGKENRKGTVMGIISGKIIKKYRLNSALQRETGINRRHAKYGQKRIEVKKRKRLEKLQQKVNNDIKCFLSRDDNSRVLPGKKDKIKDGKELIQKRVLNDYLHNLHLKFCAESNYSVSLTTFSRNRPSNIALVNFASRSVCLCTKHQNFALKLRCLKNINVCTCTSPDKFVEIYCQTVESIAMNDLFSKIPEGKVKFQEWRRIKMKDGKERMRIVDIELERSEFISMMKKNINEFVQHIRKVKQQYGAIKKMKDSLSENHVLVQMDFSENYSCQTMEEIQSAYWNSSMVTLHPTVMYYRKDNDLVHESQVFVSELLHHNSSMVYVYAIIAKVIENVKKLVPKVEHVHFWTDSPTSQYRNKNIFCLISQFKKKYGVKASWHYFECGHGKSACDGIGGTTKRNADNAVKQGKVIIQDAHDFFAWSQSQISQSQIGYQYIDQEEFERARLEVESQNTFIKPVKGTMLIHAVAESNAENTIIFRETTCVCSECFSTNGFNEINPCSWKTHSFVNADRTKSRENENVEGIQKESVAQNQIIRDRDVEQDNSESNSDNNLLDVDDFVLVRYDKKTIRSQDPGNR